MNNCVKLTFELSILKKRSSPNRRGIPGPLNNIITNSYEEVSRSEVSTAIQALHRGSNTSYKLNYEKITQSYWALKVKAPDFSGTITIKNKEHILHEFSSTYSVKNLLDGGVSLNGILSGFLKNLIDTMLEKKIFSVEIEFQEFP